MSGQMHLSIYHVWLTLVKGRKVQAAAFESIRLTRPTYLSKIDP
jgi:hypothetical protein